MSTPELQPGQAVVNTKGRVGIVTEAARKAGVWKGQVGVMFVGSPYNVAYSPADLEPVTLAIIRRLD